MPITLQIPFGKNKISGILHDASAVANGLACNCVCPVCHGSLEAVHWQDAGKQNYFRHHGKHECKGTLESHLHIAAKDVLMTSNEVWTTEYAAFQYLKCDIETMRYGRVPDAYVSNDTQSLIVEIYYSHRIARSTLQTYLDNGERVLEIDISGERGKSIFNYEEFKRLVLQSAGRELHPKNDLRSNAVLPVQKLWLAGLVVLTCLLLLKPAIKLLKRLFKLVRKNYP